MATGRLYFRGTVAIHIVHVIMLLGKVKSRVVVTYVSAHSQLMYEFCIRRSTCHIRLKISRFTCSRVPEYTPRPYWQSATKEEKKKEKRTSETNHVRCKEQKHSQVNCPLFWDEICNGPVSERTERKGQRKFYLVSQGHVVGSLFGGEKGVDVERPLEVTVLPLAIVEPYRTSVERGDRSRCGTSAGRDVELNARKEQSIRRGTAQRVCERRTWMLQGPGLAACATTVSVVC